MPRQVDHDERREQLSAAVWQVVSEHGLDGLTLRAVGDAAGCTTGRVAHYFRDKNALLTHARDVMHRRMVARIDALGDFAGPRERLRAVLQEGVPLDEERRLTSTVWAYFLMAARTDPALLAEHVVRHESWIRRVTGLLRDAYAVPPDDLELRARNLVALLEGLALCGVATPELYPPDLLVRAVDNHLDLLLGAKE
ncbi:TetR/AcrR family transcriptional regulator [Catellatospora chokoriensis]|uniref:TetR family transcriptional regulator n=1 Tax=Catellatospora chokoriensis TaxID=310353 RepID=A0A8J3K297_9ACTN|nr:TetR/AcrR family transcriptional regulator [Catellatospora chokoriensis]GIF89400.1 TetR family transcriptional regulator [Catellatospora chokoriensis]